MRAAYDALDTPTKARDRRPGDGTLQRLLAGGHRLSQGGVRGDNQDKLRPVRHRLVRIHPVTGRKSLYLSAHIGSIVGWPVPEARAFIRDLTEHATQRRVRSRACLAAMGPGDLGQPHDDAPGPPLRRSARDPRHAAIDHPRRRHDRSPDQAAEPAGENHGRSTPVTTLRFRRRSLRDRYFGSLYRPLRSRRSRRGWTGTPSWCSTISP